MSLTLTPLQYIPLIRRDDNLADIVVNVFQENSLDLQDNDILVFAQKIISKAEGRTVKLASVSPSQRALELAAQTEKDPRIVELILQESNEVIRTRVGAIIVEHKLGFVCANAGIDHSNVDAPLLAEHPERPEASIGEISARREGEMPKIGYSSFHKIQTGRQKGCEARSNPKRENALES